MIRHPQHSRGWRRIISAPFFFLVCLFAAASPVHASVSDSSFVDSTYRVSEIIIIGNEVTKEYIIQREMSLKPGSVITHEAVDFDIGRIYSLQLFTKVNIAVMPEDSSLARLVVYVTERWYFYPFPVVGLKDNDWNHLYYGLGVAHNNVGGQAVQLAFQFAFGYDPYVALSFYHPAISSDNSYFLSSRVSYSVQKNKSLVSQAGGVNFDEYLFDVDGGIGKRFSIFSSVSVDVDFFRLTVSDNKAGRTLSADASDQYVSLNAGYRYDTRDLAEYPAGGSLIRLGVSKCGFGSVVNFQRYAFDYRRYIPTYNDVVLLTKVFGNFAAGGRVPNYQHVYFGYGDRIRGHYNEIFEGEDILGTSAEIHIPLLSPRYYRLKYMPVEQFKDIRYAVNLALFADAGTVWYRADKPGLHDVTSGFGAGVHILFAYSFVFRLEYAFSENFRRGQAILNLGAAL
jgi:outer membrane protein assembly factor BamA